MTMRISIITSLSVLATLAAGLSFGTAANASDQSAIEKFEFSNNQVVEHSGRGAGGRGIPRPRGR